MLEVRVPVTVLAHKKSRLRSWEPYLLLALFLGSLAFLAIGVFTCELLSIVKV